MTTTPPTPSLGYVLVYVPDVARATDFWQRAFGLAIGFAHDSGQYTELATGATRLGFVAEALAESSAGDFRPNRAGEPPAAIELALTTPDVEGAWQQALAAGATAVKPPTRKPWGQVVAYVRDPDGVLVELCTPM
ncbi:MAG TPA: VOC family protein [Kofleriaceae bacterium]|nr:VOC family protein [Kofleriaceae bacterium]